MKTTTTMMFLLIAAMAALVPQPAIGFNGFGNSFRSSSAATSVLFESFDSQDVAIDPCYDEKAKRPKSCVPDFVNAAFGVRVEATSTCGSVEREFCATPAGSKNERCSTCDAKSADRAHPAEFLTDLHNPNNETCWQSDYLDGQNASLTISLGKKYELTYISMHFCSEKPEHMIIYKSMDHGKTWQPFQECVRT